MAEENATPPPAPPARSKDELALELMKFISITTGYGRSATPGAGFSGKLAGRSPEEHAEALFQLYQRCRDEVGK